MPNYNDFFLAPKNNFPYNVWIFKILVKMSNYNNIDLILFALAEPDISGTGPTLFRREGDTVRFLHGNAF